MANVALLLKISCSLTSQPSEHSETTLSAGRRSTGASTGRELNFELQSYIKTSFQLKQRGCEIPNQSTRNSLLLSLDTLKEFENMA